MLTITVPGAEFWDDENEVFIKSPSTVIELEHSLASLSKWEEIFEKPFLSTTDRTDEETLTYVKCMTLTPDVPPDVYLRLSEQNIKDIGKYMNLKMTATWFADTPHKPTGEVLTAELIQYWMISAGIPLEWEHRHLNKLFTLLRVFGAKNSPPKKMSPEEAARRQAEINRQRRAMYESAG